MIANYHTHTLYSDGKGTMQEVIEKAIELKLNSIAFSDHSPLPFETIFSFKLENKEEYLDTFNQLKDRYKDQINLYMSMEVDYIPGISKDFSFNKTEFRTDFLIGGVHMVKASNGELWFTDGPDYKIYDQGLKDLFDNDIKKAVRTFYYQTNEMIENQEFEIIAHFDKIKMHNRNRYFSEDEKWYKHLVAETIELIKQKNIIVEINTRGLYKKRSDTTFPSPEIIKTLYELNIPMIVSSDAHLPEELVLGFDYAEKLLKQFGIKELAHFDGNKWNLREIQFRDR